MTSGLVKGVAAEQATGRRWVQHGAKLSTPSIGGPLATHDGIVVGINWGSLGAPNSGIFYAQSMPQLRQQISKYVADVVWK